MAANASMPITSTIAAAAKRRSRKCVAGTGTAGGQRNRQRDRNDAGHQHRAPIGAGDQHRPLPHHDDRGDAPEDREHPAAEIGDADRHRRQHERRADPQRQILAGAAAARDARVPRRTCS